MVLEVNQVLASACEHGSVEEEGRCQKVTVTDEVANQPHAAGHARLPYRQKTVWDYESIIYEIPCTEQGDCHLFLDQQLSNGTLSPHILGFLIPCT